MPVSPADFEFYSRMTGQPIPNTPAGRMAIAPQVYNMRRGGGGFGRVLRGAAKGALAAGALAGAGALALATQEEMAKKPSAPQTGTAKDQNVNLDSSALKTPVESVRDKAEAFAAYSAGKVYNPQFSVGEPEKAKRPRVTENLTDTGMSTETTPGGQKVTVSATDAAVSEAPVRDRADALLKSLKTSSGEELVGTPATPEQVQEFRNRYSGQTQVPAASPEVANESLAAQRASVQAPTEPRVGVRQQPSSGVIQTDLSNVAAKEYSVGKIEPGTEMITDPELNKLAQQYEFYEASQDISPFQAPGTEAFPQSGMDLLAEQSRYVKTQEKDFARQDLAREILAGFAKEEKDRMAGQATAPRPFSQKEANIRIAGLVREGIEHLEGGQPSIQFPAGEGSKYESMTLDPSGDINVKFRKGDTTYSYPQTPEGSEAFAQLAGMYNNPGPAETTGESPFVTNKGREVGAVMKRVEEAKAAAAKPVTFGEIAGDFVSALNPFKDRKAEAQRRQQAERMVIQGHGVVKDPVERQKLIDFYMKDK